MHNLVRLSLASFALLCFTAFTGISASAAGYGGYSPSNFGLPYGYWGYRHGSYWWIRYGCYRRGITVWNGRNRRNGWVTYCK
jgi:hypothetical protein